MALCVNLMHVSVPYEYGSGLWSFITGLEVTNLKISGTDMFIRSRILLLLKSLYVIVQ